MNTGYYTKLFHKKPGLILIAVIVMILFIFFLTRSCSISETQVKPKIEPVIEAVYALGTVKSDRSINIRFGMNSIVTRFSVKEGDTVQKGSLLLITDSGIQFRSPLNGIISAKNYNENEMVPSGQNVLTITDMKSLYVKLSLDQQSITSVKKGMKTEISFENLRNLKVTGTVESIYQSGGEFVVRITIPSMPEMVLPEMTCDTAIIIREDSDALLIPASAITNSSVRIKRNGKEQIIKIKSRAVENGWAEVLDDTIKPDDIIYSKNSDNREKKPRREDPVFR